MELSTQPHSDAERKTEVEHWDNAWRSSPKARLPSTLSVSTANTVRILRGAVKPGASFLEIGCAPGKVIAYVAAVLQARVSGLDYSETGIRQCRELFGALGLSADLRREDVFSTSFAPNTFDVVFSNGVIEHFDDPSRIVRIHVELLKPGGTALIVIPRMSGFYLKLAQYLDPDNVAIHNLSIMNCASLLRLAPPDLSDTATTAPAGRPCFSMLNFSKRFGPAVSTALRYLADGVGLLSPADIGPLSPLLVLRIRRTTAAL